ncbi:MAG: glycosyltransferase family 1 protein [Ilumatobacteraceae bacterium]
MSAPTTASAITVAYDASPLLGPLTGVGMAVQHTANALAGRDDVVLKRYACSFRGTLLDDMTRLPLPAAVAQRLWGATSLPRVDRWLRPADLIHGTNYTVPPSRLPRIVTVYDCWFLRHPDQAGGDVGRAGKVLRRAVRSGAVVHATSDATADAVRELLDAERVEVIPLAALPAPLLTDTVAPVAELDGVPFVLALGTLERRKNLPRLIAAFGRIAGSHHDLRLVIAGSDGDDRPAIDAAIDALPIVARDRVMITGRIASGAKQWLLGAATVLAYPSLDEGFGFPILEAMQCGVAVVASTAGSIPEVAGDGALLVAADDVDALAGALQTVIDDPAVRSSLIAAGSERVGHFSWEVTATSLADLYHRTVREGT